VLYLVLLLVLGALGLLVTALITASSLWAWVSIGLSAVAGLLLVADVVRRNARRRAAEAGGREAAAEAQASAETPEAAPGKDPERSAAPEKDATGEKDSEQAGQPGCAEQAGQAREPEPDPPGVPAVEQSTPDDAALVSELEVEVVVVDELPRYHRTGCDWLGDREVIPIPVKEARGLGFTPCARCTPDAHLAAAHRTSA
jgi:hypothetical protein